MPAKERRYLVEIKDRVEKLLAIVRNPNEKFKVALLERRVSGYQGILFELGRPIARGYYKGTHYTRKQYI